MHLFSLFDPHDSQVSSFDVVTEVLGTPFMAFECFV
jgi:hypothetical protein